MIYDYSNLVNVYADEATRCLDSKCWFAAIALSWSTVEYAIEHELRGGSTINPYSLAPIRDPIDYDARNITKKLNIFFKLYPSLQPSKNVLLQLYYYRNVYLHAKIDDLVHTSLSEKMSKVTLREKGDHTLSITVTVAGDPNISPAHGKREIELIGTVPFVATKCCQLMRRFLNELGHTVGTGLRAP